MKKSSLVSIGIVVAFILGSGVAYYSQQNFSTSEAYINEQVKNVKKRLQLPNQIDEATRLVDITAEPKAVRYHYVLSNIDSSQLSNDYLKNYMLAGVCKNSEILENLLNRGINMEYSIVDETQQNYFFSITKDDCPN